MARYREVEERHVTTDEGYVDRPYARPMYGNPVAWIVGLLIVVLLIMLLVFGIGHSGSSNNAPIVHRPATSSSSSSSSGSGSGSAKGTVSGNAGNTGGAANGSAGGGGTAGTTSNTP